VITFIIGGARSGKSRRAQLMAEAASGELIYVATAQPFDEEMVERIARHRSARDKRWRAVDAPIELARVITDEARPNRVLLIDCLTLWTSNILLKGLNAEAEVDRLVTALKVSPCPIFLVSNEVGLGIVPENALARRFRDVAGRLHQQVAEIAERVDLMVAGLALQMK
jgi:adenosylcobinamide kinase / adenosylcobinamide-phosphate guanylyltransferase